MISAVIDGWPSLLFLLLAGHALADFALQHEAMGLGKNRNHPYREKKGAGFPHWYYWLTSHALIHGGIVFLITGNLFIGLLETVVHWIIDYVKCEGWTNLHQDQALHVLSKIGYLFLV